MLLESVGILFGCVSQIDSFISGERTSRPGSRRIRRRFRDRELNNRAG